MRYLITFSYDGTNFNGYQKQDGLRSVQEELEKCLTSINDDRFVKVTSSGRTDKGVHALRCKAHFDISVNISEYKLKRAMNSKLPDDISVSEVVKVSDDFHARFMVKEKIYCYRLNMGDYNPLLRHFVYQYLRKLDVDLMSRAIKYFIGEHDFKSFTPSKDCKENTVRIIKDAYIVCDNDIVSFYFIGNGFIKYQIRNMVGYLIKIGEHKKNPDSIPAILSCLDRRCASITAHPEGLCLMDVIY